MPKFKIIPHKDIKGVLPKGKRITGECILDNPSRADLLKCLSNADVYRQTTNGVWKLVANINEAYDKVTAKELADAEDIQPTPLKDTVKSHKNLGNPITSIEAVEYNPNERSTVRKKIIKDNLNSSSAKSISDSVLLGTSETLPLVEGISSGTTTTVDINVTDNKTVVDNKDILYGTSDTLINDSISAGTTGDLSSGSVTLDTDDNTTSTYNNNNRYNNNNNRKNKRH